MEYKYLPKDLATRLTEATADVLNDTLIGGGVRFPANVQARGKLLIQPFPFSSNRFLRRSVQRLSSAKETTFTRIL